MQTVYFITANMPDGMARAQIDALLAEKCKVIPLPTASAAMDVLRREMTSDSPRYCVVRNPATSNRQSRMWGFIISNDTDPAAEFEETISGKYCPLEFIFTDDQDTAQRSCTPAPTYHLPEGYVIPADRCVSWDLLTPAEEQPAEEQKSTIL